MPQRGAEPVKVIALPCWPPVHRNRQVLIHPVGGHASSLMIDFSEAPLQPEAPIFTCGAAGLRVEAGWFGRFTLHGAARVGRAAWRIRAQVPSAARVTADGPEGLSAAADF